MAIIYLIVYLLYLLGVALVFYILYLQLCYNIKKAMKQLDMNEKKSELTLKNTHQLIEKVNLTSKFLSPYCFVFIQIKLLVIIGTTFWLFGHKQIEVIAIPFLVWHLFWLWYVNSQSEDIKQGLNNIKHHIRYLVVSDDGFIEINGRVHSEAYARSLIISLLDEFKGFDVFGYGNLGKPYLAHILVLLVGYVAILMKFQLGGHITPSTLFNVFSNVTTD